MRYLLMTGAVACVAFAQDFKLPAPFATPSVLNNSRVINRPAGAQLKVPAGFTVNEYMTGFERPRWMILGLAIHLYPGTDTIWITFEERDEMGDDLVAEYFRHIAALAVFFLW